MFLLQYLLYHGFTAQANATMLSILQYPCMHILTKSFVACNKKDTRLQMTHTHTAIK
jgi:hypothetical protein